MEPRPGALELEAGPSGPVAARRAWGAWIALALRESLRTGVALAAGLLVGALLILVLGASPVRAVGVMLETVFGTRSGFVDTVLHAVPLLLIALGYAIAYQARVWTVGGEGQFHLGAVAAATIAFITPAGVPGTLALLVAVLAAAGAGMLWAVAPGWLLARRQVNEIVSTLMLNFVGIFVMAWLIRVPFRDPYNALAQTPEFPGPFQAPSLAGSRLHLGVVLVLALVPAVHWLAYRSALGYRVRAVGANPWASRAGGIDVGRTILVIFLISGALGGLAGAVHVLGVTHRLLNNLSPGFGYTAIMVALLARNHPLAVVPAAFFFSALSVGSEGIQVDLRIPSDFMLVFMGLLVLFVLAGDVLWKRRAAP